MVAFRFFLASLVSDFHLPVSRAAGEGEIRNANLGSGYAGSGAKRASVRDGALPAV